MTVVNDEAQLIAKVLLTKDQQAFATLVIHHQQSLRQYCRRLCTPDLDLADDIAQETLIQAYRKLSLFNGSGKFISWLFRIAYFQYLQYLRSHKSYEEFDENSADEQEQVSNHQSSAAFDDLEKAMSVLSVNERNCITLHYSFGYTQAEIADLVDMPLGTIKSQIKRGKEKLIRVLNESSNSSCQNISGAA
ncbi:RNA polymerase sigma factor [Thalassotalea atypica]|uniref:RNA polymerase sigma factor n=1 Tax=Thalassotalea atypica TaxID=2054316 RepID=UPI002573702B|nr:RNA polymerase sigma factor [Thalassotalea atypica]